MFTWLKDLITRPDPETLEAQTQRKKQRRASQNHSRRVRARERELRQHAQGSRRRAPFYLGRVCRRRRHRWGLDEPVEASRKGGFTRPLTYGWTELRCPGKWDAGFLL